MTTIAYDTISGEIAADSQATEGSGAKYNCQKLYRVGDKIVATAGGVYSALAFIEWLELWDGDPDWEERPDFINLDADEDFECLVLAPSGDYTINRLFVPAPAKGNRFITLGSGGQAAMGAMLAGASPKQAVAIAKKVDSYTGGRIVTMTKWSL